MRCAALNLKRKSKIWEKNHNKCKAQKMVSSEWQGKCNEKVINKCQKLLEER